MKLKRLSTLIVFIFFVSILSVNYHHRENRISQDDTLTIDIVDNNLDFSNINKYIAPLTYRFITTIIKSNTFSILHILTFRFNTRAPPA